MSFISLKDQGWYDRGDRMAESLGVLTAAGKKLFNGGDETQPVVPPAGGGLGGAGQPAFRSPQAVLRPAGGGVGFGALASQGAGNGSADGSVKPFTFEHMATGNSDPGVLDLRGGGDGGGGSANNGILNLKTQDEKDQAAGGGGLMGIFKNLFGGR
ncbi:MAG: hypothetical protein LBK60_01500 [Verrucomicrobiales bacterium]|jgi:hypothetical protein|nr:hypothetical protein [Verrucomicrobiales bacterium]